jgi:hypothetical protein
MARERTGTATPVWSDGAEPRRGAVGGPSLTLDFLLQLFSLSLGCGGLVSRGWPGRSVQDEFLVSGGEKEMR